MTRLLDTQLNYELDVATRLAREAGLAILAFYRTSFSARNKMGVDGREEPVTEADHAANEIIVEGLRQAFPKDGILSEELEDTDQRLSRKRVWMIDPIDGTNGFIAGDDDFAVQIGLAVEGVAVLGVVFEPAHDVMLFAARNSGTWLERNGQSAIRASVSAETELTRMRIAVSRTHQSHRMRRVVEILNPAAEVDRGSVGVKVGLIVERDCDLYIHLSPRTKQWDTCAPEVILLEAGGRITDLFGQPLRYNQLDLQNRNGIVATNGAVHDDVINALKPLMIEFGRSPA